MANFILLLTLPDRAVYWLEDSRPAMYLLVDRDAGAVMINSAPYTPELEAALTAIAPPRYLFVPSRFGAIDIAAWRRATGAELLAGAAEVPALGCAVDVALEGTRKLTRTLDLLPMSGRTPGTYVLRARNLPGLMFFGPALEPQANGWPGLVRHADDHSYETRLFGALALQDLRFEYAFTDTFAAATAFGPGASQAMREGLDQLWLT
ncbi:MAG TPA: hypothetical protein VFN52_02655 [Acidiferrobacteraceae bacterium]|nr:hypothetical protein [Acidiferrobacteraceae bacterium]